MAALWLQQGVTYGPVLSRRLGRSLGVNLLPDGYKLCSFDCVYCHYGPTHVGQYELPSAEEVVSALEEYLQERPLIDYITNRLIFSYYKYYNNVSYNYYHKLYY